MSEPEIMVAVLSFKHNKESGTDDIINVMIESGIYIRRETRNRVTITAAV